MTTRRFGIEIEFMANYAMSRSEVADKLTAVGIPTVAAGYSDHRVVPGTWKVKPDGSLQGGNGMELVSPPLGSDGFDLIDKASAVLLGFGAMVNRSCGLHVHVDAAGLNLQAMKKLAAIYMENERVIDSFLPPSRRGETNRFAKSTLKTNLAALKASRSTDQIASAILPREHGHMRRYVKLNFISYSTHGTVEFRHHSGTVDAAKIKQWVLVCQQLVDLAVKEQDVPITSPSVRPHRSRSMATVFDMISRPEGASAEEMRIALNRQTKTSMGYWLRQYGIGYRLSRGRYYLDERASTSTAPSTLEDFMTKLEMTNDQKSFWIARAQLLGTATSMEITT